MKPLGELFDPDQELNISSHYREHWSQAGAIVFITFRTHDSIPKSVLKQWEREKQDWIERIGYRGHWSEQIPKLSDESRLLFKKHFNRKRERHLDTFQGKCPLRHPQLAQIVADSLMFFDGERYRMGDFVVMPNHVHLLASFPTAEAMVKQCDSWMHFTAFEINKQLGQKGKLWQQEPFDHLVRSALQYDYLRNYIARNPREANLRPNEYLYRKYG